MDSASEGAQSMVTMITTALLMGRLSKAKIVIYEKASEERIPFMKK